MKIINLKAENIKRLVAIDITPDGNVVKITGKNGQGKTSVLDSIWWGLAGTKNIQSKPIRTGEDGAYIYIDLGDLKVTRKFRYNKKGEVTTSLKVEGNVGSPQAAIDELLGDLTFDPLKFSRMDKKTQFETLKQFVPDVDFDKIDADNKDDYEERRNINRQHKEKQSAYEQIDIDVKTAPTKIIDTSVLLEEINEATEKNTVINSLESEKQRIENEIKERQLRLDEISSELKDAGEKKDIKELSDQVENAQKHNDAVKKRREKVDLIDSASRLAQESEKLTNRIERRNKEKEKAISNADLPVKNLSFGDSEILLDGQPFDQASDAEQLKASVNIAMALNPKLEIIRIRDGSLLDDDSMKELEKMAEEKDFQIWIESVDGSGKVGFVIEEGKLKQEEQPEEVEEWE